METRHMNDPDWEYDLARDEALIEASQPYKKRVLRMIADLDSARRKEFKRFLSANPHITIRLISTKSGVPYLRLLDWYLGRDSVTTITWREKIRAAMVR